MVSRVSLHNAKQRFVAFNENDADVLTALYAKRAKRRK